MNRKDFKGEVTHAELEEGKQVLLDFEKLRKVAACEESVVPVVVQNADTKEVLILAYANEKAVQYTIENKVAAFWSTSRNELWVKGKTSGDQLDIVEVCINCEQNSLLYKVKLVGKGSCHTKNKDGQTRFGCYYRKINDGHLDFIDS